MKKVLTFIKNFILFFCAGKGDWMREAIEEGLVSYEGQGRDKWGH